MNSIVIDVCFRHFQMFGRTLKVSIANDNGRSAEFDAKRTYADKQRCYECGQEGHLSYKCPNNVLGNREPLQKKNNKKTKRSAHTNADPFSSNDSDYKHNDDVNYSKLINLNMAIMAANFPFQESTAECSVASAQKKKKYKQSKYLSDDEEELSD